MADSENSRTLSGSHPERFAIAYGVMAGTKPQLWRLIVTRPRVLTGTKPMTIGYLG